MKILNKFFKKMRSHQSPIATPADRSNVRKYFERISVGLSLIGLVHCASPKTALTLDIHPTSTTMSDDLDGRIGEFLTTYRYNTEGEAVLGAVEEFDIKGIAALAPAHFCGPKGSTGFRMSEPPNKIGESKTLDISNYVINYAPTELSIFDTESKTELGILEFPRCGDSNLKDFFGWAPQSKHEFMIKREGSYYSYNVDSNNLSEEQLGYSDDTQFSWIHGSQGYYTLTDGNYPIEVYDSDRTLLKKIDLKVTESKPQDCVLVISNADGMMIKEVKPDCSRLDWKNRPIYSSDLNTIGFFQYKQGDVEIQSKGLFISVTTGAISEVHKDKVRELEQNRNKAINMASFDNRYEARNISKPQLWNGTMVVTLKSKEKGETRSHCGYFSGHNKGDRWIYDYKLDIKSGDSWIKESGQLIVLILDYTSNAGCD